MNQQEQKQAAALAAVSYVEDGMLLGVGTGSTVNLFIDALAASGVQLDAAVSSSEASTKRLKNHGIPVLDLNAAGPLALYIDGADEADANGALVKGGGGALTREKIVAQAADKFICVVDASKQVDVLGAFPLPVEVIPMARSLVARELVKLGGQPVWREGFVTDNGNVILDVHKLRITEPKALEEQLNNLPGVVTNGLFARRGADLLLVGSASGVASIELAN